MDAVFKALGDASRRQLLDRLNARNGQSLRELSEGLDMSRQAAGRWIGRYERGRLMALSHLKRSLEGPSMSEPEFVYVTYIQATAEKLYRALTDPELIKIYMGGYGPESEWRVGSPVKWKMDPNGEFEDLGQRVLEAEPGKRLSYTWHTLQPMHRELFDSDEDFATACQERSRVTFDIEPAEAPEMGIKLTFTHDGFDGPDSKMLEGVSGGWIMILSALKTQLEGGKLLAEQEQAEPTPAGRG